MVEVLIANVTFESDSEKQRLLDDIGKHWYYNSERGQCEPYQVNTTDGELNVVFVNHEGNQLALVIPSGYSSGKTQDVAEHLLMAYDEQKKGKLN